MKQKYFKGCLCLALASVCAYSLVHLNRSFNNIERSLDRHYKNMEIAIVLPLCGKNYKENTQRAREMGYPWLAEKIEYVAGKDWSELCRELGLERLIEEK